MQVLGGLIAAGGVALFLLLMSVPADWLASLFFYAFAAIAVAAGILAVTARDPVHNALWFAIVLLSTSGLFLLVGAQFLAAGTIIVYAGAIIVTFLFVIMLAQSEGQALYDRMARSPIRSSLTAFGLLFGLVFAIWQVQTSPYREVIQPKPVARDAQAGAAAAGQNRSTAVTVETRKRELSATDFEQRLVRTSDLRKRAIDPLTGEPLLGLASHQNGLTVLSVFERVLSPSNRLVVGSAEEADEGVPSSHVRGLGGSLFTNHLVTVEVAGVILFVALVGAMAIAAPRLNVSRDIRV